MGVAGGIFNIIQRGQFSAAATASLRAAQPTQKSKDETSTNPLAWSLKRNESAIASHWRLALESAARTTPRLDIVKRLEKALNDIDGGRRAALGQLLMPPGDGFGIGAGNGHFASTSLEITVETIVVTETRVEIFA